MKTQNEDGNLLFICNAFSCRAEFQQKGFAAKIFLAVIFTMSIGVPALAETAPETFKIKIKADLEKIVPNLQYPGTVTETPAPGAGQTETVLLVLNDCKSYGGANHCSAFWKKTLSMDQVKITYWVGVFNSDKTGEHAITLTICRSGEESLGDCTRTLGSEVDIKGASVPKVSLFNNNYLENPFYQPSLRIGDDLK